MSGDDDTEKKVEAEVDQEEVEKAKAEIAEEVRIFHVWCMSHMQIILGNVFDVLYPANTLTISVFIL